MTWRQKKILNNMGSRGIRKKNVSISSQYEEPNLLRSVESVIQNAREKGYYNGDSLDITKVIGEHKDIRIEQVEMAGSLSGSLDYKNGFWVMSVNKSHNPKRQKFTLAHEYAHYLLHKENSLSFVDTTFFRGADKTSIEYVANDFATNLLMPESVVRKLIDNDNIKNIGDLSEKFGVSAAAMKVRVIQLGYKVK